MAPQVELSTTLADLYSLDGGKSDDVALVYAFPNPTQLAASLPESTKYRYQGPRIIKLSADTIARMSLGCMPQYFGFVAGAMDLYLFDLDKTRLEMAYDRISFRKATPTHRIDAERVHKTLQDFQRPKLHFVEDSKKVAAISKKKAVVTPMDFLDGNGPVVDQDVHWDLLSKRTLALSELPSPPTEVIDTILRADQIDDAAVLEEEIDRMLECIASRPLPFVVKLPQAMGGHGVYMVKSEEERKDTLTDLSAELPSMFQQMAANAEAKTPVSLLVQDIVNGPSDGVSIFVTKAGRPVYISTSEQILDAREQWAGGFMDYTRQQAKDEEYRDLMGKVAEYVYKRGYYGPLGVDVMTDEQGRQLIVDMNIRQTGSYTLGLMKKHFYEKRNLPIGGLVCPLAVMGDRDGFEKKFAKEIEVGTIVIAAWCRAKGGPGGLFVWSACGLLLGAENRDNMVALMERLDAIAIKK